jgi:hypothetical protein
MNALINRLTALAQLGFPPQGFSQTKIGARRGAAPIVLGRSTPAGPGNRGPSSALSNSPLSASLARA